MLAEDGTLEAIQKLRAIGVRVLAVGVRHAQAMGMDSRQGIDSGKVRAFIDALDPMPPRLNDSRV
jgi:hypothetical protein